MEPTVNELNKLRKNSPPLKKLKIKKIINSLFRKQNFFKNEFEFRYNNIENDGEFGDMLERMLKMN